MCKLDYHTKRTLIHVDKRYIELRYKWESSPPCDHCSPSSVFSYKYMSESTPSLTHWSPFSGNVPGAKKTGAKNGL